MPIIATDNKKINQSHLLAGSKQCEPRISLECKPDSVSFTSLQPENKDNNVWKWAWGIGAAAVAGIGLFFAFKSGNGSAAKEAGHAIAREAKNVENSLEQLNAERKGLDGTKEEIIDAIPLIKRKPKNK